MRVAIVTTGLTWRPGGSYLVLFEHANRLVASGHEVRLVFPTGAPTQAGRRKLVDRARAGATQLRRRRRRRVDWFDLDPRVQLDFPPGIGPGAIPEGDVVIAASWHSAHDVMALPDACGTPFYLVHHYEGHKYPSEVIDATLALPMTKLCVSRATCADLSERGFGPVAYVPNGIDLDTYRLISDPARRRPVVAMNYVDKEIKDPATGLEALRRARSAVPDLEAVLFGTGPEPRDLPGWIEYRRGLPTEALVREVYNRAAVVLSSSVLEGFGFTVAEAMACGCAAVATASGGIEDFAVDGESALLSPPHDAGRLARNLERMLTSDDLRQETARRGREAVSAFTWERSSAMLVAALSAAGPGADG